MISCGQFADCGRQNIPRQALRVGHQDLDPIEELREIKSQVRLVHDENSTQFILMAQGIGLPFSMETSSTVDSIQALFPWVFLIQAQNVQKQTA